MFFSTETTNIYVLIGQDSDLLLSCGKDNRILCWNPNTAEVQCELASSNQWSFDVSWCPRNPAVIASSSFDGHVSVYSLMGGQQQVWTEILKIRGFFFISESYLCPESSSLNKNFPHTCGFSNRNLDMFCFLKTHLFSCPLLNLRGKKIILLLFLRRPCC